MRWMLWPLVKSAIMTFPNLEPGDGAEVRIFATGAMTPLTMTLHCEVSQEPIQWKE